MGGRRDVRVNLNSSDVDVVMTGDAGEKQKSRSGSPIGPAGEKHSQTDVQSALREVTARQKWRSMTPAQRKRVNLDAQRTRASFDLPPAIIEILGLVAEAEGLSPASVVVWFVDVCLHQYLDGELEPDNDQVYPSRGRYFFQYVPDDLAALKDQLEARIRGQKQNGEKSGGKDFETSF